jgi:hypothetical protein
VRKRSDAVADKQPEPAVPHSRWPAVDSLARQKNYGVVTGRRRLLLRSRQAIATARTRVCDRIESCGAVKCCSGGMAGGAPAVVDLNLI